MSRSMRGEGEPIRGKRLTEEELKRREARRAKNHEKKEKSRHQEQVRKNFGFDDCQQVGFCDNCQSEQPDVYTFLRRDMKTRFGPTRVNLCDGCFGFLTMRGADLVPVPIDVTEEIVPRSSVEVLNGRLVGDRKKLF